MKRVLITGVTGYIGSHLARDLLPEYQVYGLVREPLNRTYLEDIASQIRFVYYDGTYDSMKTALEISRPDLVYHLAAYYTGARGEEHISKLVGSNITLGAYLLEAMAACGAPALVYATTYMTHYQGAEYRPVNLYAATKQAFSDLLAYYTDLGLMRSVTLVISDTYGPGDCRPKVLNVVKKAAETGERMKFSVGDIPYDVVYIDDVIAAFRSVGERVMGGESGSETFQIVPEAPLSLCETVEKMLQLNDLTLNAGWGERPPAEREMTELVRLYPTPPGWRPQVPLEIGLKKLYQEV